MCKPNVHTRVMVIAAFAGALLFTSCQKETLKPTVEEDAMSTASLMRTAANKSKPSDADKAYDKAVKEIMQDMMQQMHKMEMTCDPDIDFANMMIMHHDAGIKMADAELMYGHEAEGKALAQKTKEGNEASKARLQAFLSSHPTPEPLSKELCKQYMKEFDEAMRNMMECMRKAPDTDDVDVDFANQMICHHQGAIAMSRTEIKYGDDAAAINEAKKIIDEQSKEIQEFAAFINEHGIPSKVH